MLVPDLARFRALTFDCYGTLIDWESGIIAATAPWFAAAGRPHARERVLEEFGRYQHRHEEGDPAPLYPEVLRRTALDMQAALGLPREEAAARRFGASVGEWPAFPDSPAALTVLRRHYARLVILSNVDDASLARSRARLGDPFDFAVTAEQIGTYKPDPRHFETGLARLAEAGIAREQVLHVAQSLYHDHGPARALGLASVWINRRAGKSGVGATPPVAPGAAPDFTVTSLAALAAHVAAAFAR